MKKTILFSISLLLFFIISIAVTGYLFLYYPNTTEESTLVIPKNATFEQVLDSLTKKEILTSDFTFKIVATALKYPHYVQRGKYPILKNENNRNLIAKLYRGQHYPVKFTFNNVRTKEGLIDKIGNHFLFPKEELAQLLDDSLFLASYELNRESVVSIFIPNTYEIYYDIDAIDFFEKMYHYYQKFWNEKRVARAAEIELTPLEIITLASIVEEENFRENEKAIIAGVYINRLKKGMKLQADPTVKFAIGDFSLKRILYEHLEIDSPYNTYLYAGLPPAPIRIPEASTIDSVLYYQKHKFIYMCAKADLSGYHLFTDNLNEHLRNAARYHQAIK